MNQNRRQFLKWNTSLAGVALMGTSLKAIADVCQITAPQTPGPFYPGESAFTKDNNLTVIHGRPQRAKGQMIYIMGYVRDQFCMPLENAAVEIWQACASGKYNNPKDPNPAPLDPNFKYWGETFTDKEGKYIFKSIIPGAYPADTNWMRPPHIHFKVAKLGYKELISQMYFKGNPYNNDDLILKQVPAAQRAGVIVDFKPSGTGYEPGSLSGRFDLTLMRIR